MRTERFHDHIARLRAGEETPTLTAEIMFDFFAVPVGEGPRGYLWPEDDTSWNFAIRFPSKARDWFNDRIVFWRDNSWVLFNDARLIKLMTCYEDVLRLLGNKPYEIQGRYTRDESRVDIIITDSDGIKEGSAKSTTPARALLEAILIAELG